MSFFVLPAFDLFLIKYFYLLMSTQSDGFRHHIFTDILGDSPPLLPSTITLTSACALSSPNSLHSTFLLQISPCLHYSLFLLSLWLLFFLPWSPLLFHYLYLHSYTHKYTSKQTKSVIHIWHKTYNILSQELRLLHVIIFPIIISDFFHFT